jgi:hypothetical protein
MTPEERLREMAKDATHYYEGCDCAGCIEDRQSCEAGAEALAITREIADDDPWEQKGATSPETVLFFCRYCGLLRVHTKPHIPEAERLDGHNDGEVMPPRCLYTRCVQLHHGEKP